MMKIVKRMSILFLFLFLIPNLIQAQYTYDLNSNERLYLPEWKYNFGDRSEWINPNYDDSSWTTLYPDPVRLVQKGIHWCRATVMIRGKPSDTQPLALKFLNLGNAFEVYWDGVFIGRNGRVENSQSLEEPGNHLSVIKLDKELTTPGRHVLAVRMSNFHGRAQFLATRVAIDRWEEWRSYRDFFQQYTVFLFGVLTTIAILGFTLYAGLNKKKDFLFLVMFSGFSMILIYMNYRDVVGVPTTHDYLYLVQNILFHFVQILLVGYFIFFLGVGHKIVHFSIITLVLSINVFLMLVLSINVEVWLTWLFLFYISGIFIHATKRKLSGSVILFTGFCVSVILESLRFLPLKISVQQGMIIDSIATVFLLFCLILAISRRFIVQEKVHEELRIKSHRLETEMLKNTIQPHFIMNTLLSIIQLISKDPKKAIRLIELLAEEFKLTNQFSSKKLISLDEELQLCQTHLDLMALRKKTHYALITEDTDPSDTIPPMIFHTLIENGLTHSFRPDENGTFHLNAQKNGNATKYILKNGGSKLKTVDDPSESEITAGLGMRYVKSRLEESFPDCWDIKYGLQEDEWVVEIVIRR